MFSKSRILLAAVLLFGCSPSNIKRDPAYSFAPAISNQQLAVCFDRSNAEIRYPGIFADSPGTAAKQVLLTDLFEQSVLSGIPENTVFKNVVLECSTGEFACDTVVVSGFISFAERKVPVPKKNTHIKFAQSKPDFALRISNISISFPAVASTGVELSSDFVLWDNSLNRAATYGHVVVIDKKRFSGTKEDWNAAGDLFVNRLFEKMPLMKKVPLTRR